MLATATQSESKSVRCREIRHRDLDAAVALLKRGFPERADSYWRRGLARQAARALPAGYPIYGYLLEADGRPVGVLLTLYTATDFRAETRVRCNLSSWYVEPAFRSYATLLDRMPFRDRGVTLFNVTAAPHTRAMHEARGFVRYGLGQILAFPALSRARQEIRVRVVTDLDALDDLDSGERALVRDHLSYGCLCLVWSNEHTSRPLVFQRCRVSLGKLLLGAKLPCLHLIYCSSLDDLPRISGTLGRLLLRRFAVPWILLDAEAPIAGLPGRFFPGRAPRYARGPHPVGLGDLAYSEFVLFGR